MVIVIIKASPETKSLIAKNIFETLGAIRRIRIDRGYKNDCGAEKCANSLQKLKKTQHLEILNIYKIRDNST